MKKTGIVMLLSCVATLALGGLILWRLWPARLKTPDFVFYYADNQTADYPTTLGGERFAELVYERTDGRIKILIKSDGQLGQEIDVLKQMQYGGIAFARVSISQLAELIPDMNVLQLPYLYDGAEHMWSVLDGEIGEDFLGRTTAYDLVGLSWYDAGARNFYSANKPITRIEDFAGMKIRVQDSDMMSDMVAALGATAVKLNYSDVYSHLERGLVDGAENNWPSYESMRHYEVAKYYTVDEHTRVPEMQICSKEVWDQLSESDREIIRECAKESAGYERELWRERESYSRKIALEHGVTVTELSAEERNRFRQALEGTYVKYCEPYMDIVRKIIETGRQGH
ncbi:MAG: TRAP transporter substrate-binding protein [Lachnospiraceae bacterium]|nr:TRAP transporter substrate-binding protein [Lachnospiraceae bacterium]